MTYCFFAKLFYTGNYYILERGVSVLGEKTRVVANLISRRVRSGEVEGVKNNHKFKNEIINENLGK